MNGAPAPSDLRNNNIYIKTKKHEDATTNTLIFVQKKEAEEEGNVDRDMLSTLVGMNVKPTDYLLSKNVNLNFKENMMVKTDFNQVIADSTIKFSQTTN